MSRIALEVKGGLFQFAEGQKITLYIRNSLFSFDLIEANKSLPFDFPDTPHNRALVGHYQKIEQEGPDFAPAKLWVSGNIYQIGRLRFSYREGRYSGTFFWGLSSKAPEMKAFKLPQLNALVDMWDPLVRPQPQYRLRIANLENWTWPFHTVGTIYTLRVGRSAANGTVVEVSHTAATANIVDSMNALAADFNAAHSALATFAVVDDPGALPPLTQVVTITATRGAITDYFEVLEITGDNGTVEGAQRFYSLDAVEWANSRLLSDEVCFPAFYAFSFEDDERYPLNRRALFSFSAFLINRYQSGSFVRDLVPFIGLRYLIGLCAAELGVAVRDTSLATADAILFTAQHLNHQHKFVLGDLLPDISFADLLKFASQVLGFHFDLDEDLNILYIEDREALLDATAPDYTRNLYYHQNRHEKKTPPENGFRLSWKDGALDSYQEGNGDLNLQASANTMREANDGDVPNLSTIGPRGALYEPPGFQYRVPGKTGRIGGLVLMRLLITANSEAFGYTWAELYEARWKRVLDAWVNRPELTIPARFQHGEVFGIRNRRPMTVDRMKLWPEEIRIELGEDEVIGEVICKRII